MPNISLKSQALDLAFHPREDVLFAALLDGQMRCYSYNDEGVSTLKWKVRPSKKSCRALDVRPDGLQLWVGTKSGSIHTIDTESGKVLGERLHAHGFVCDQLFLTALFNDPSRTDIPYIRAAISRITALGDSMNMFASGDDEGVIKLWDTRSPPSDTNALRTYSHHTDYISDFAWLANKKHLIATSGDGTLSVIDVRSNKTRPFAQSEDQEDELLSVIPIKGGTKIVVGTQLGPLTIFDRTKGYGDCVDRFVGHPSSVETMVSLSSSQITQDVIATGSSDGLVRVVQIHPSKFLGVIAAHGTSSAGQEHEDGGDDKLQSSTEGFPIERMKLDRHKKWLGSISHDELLKLTDIEGALEGSEDDSDEQVDDRDSVNDQQDDNDQKKDDETKKGVWTGSNNGEDKNTREVQKDEDEIPHVVASFPGGQDSDSEASLPAASSERKQSKKRKKKELKREEKKKRNKGGPATSFFADL